MKLLAMPLENPGSENAFMLASDQNKFIVFFGFSPSERDGCVQRVNTADELLAALEAVLALAEIPYGNLDPDANEAFDAARAAIAKAKL